MGGAARQMRQRLGSWFGGSDGPGRAVQKTGSWEGVGVGERCRGRVCMK